MSERLNLLFSESAVVFDDSRESLNCYDKLKAIYVIANLSDLKRGDP